MTNEFAVFATRFGVPVSAAYVLPALFDGAAKKIGMHPRTLLAEATYRNRGLGDYLAELALKVAAEDAA